MDRYDHSERGDRETVLEPDELSLSQILSSLRAKRSNPEPQARLDCFVAEFTIGPVEGRTRWLLAMTDTTALPDLLTSGQALSMKAACSDCHFLYPWPRSTARPSPRAMSCPACGPVPPARARYRQTAARILRWCRAARGRDRRRRDARG